MKVVLLMSAVQIDGYVAMASATLTREEILKLTSEDFANRVLVPLAAIIRERLK